MSRTQTVAAAAKSVAKVDCEPVIIVKIDYPSGGPIYVGDKSATYGGTTVYGLITNMSELVMKMVNKKAATAGTVSLELCDINQQFQTLLETKVLQNCQVTIYQYYIGTTFPTDLITLYVGVLASPVVYDEVKRTFSFDVIPPIKSFQIPFAPTEDQITTTTTGATRVDAHSSTERKFRGKPWPTPFGRVVDVPAQLVKIGPRVRTISAIYNYTTTFLVETDPESDSNPFPLNQQINIMINGERIIGQFGTGSNSKTFTILTPLATAGRNQVIDILNTGTRPNPATDPDASRADVLYVTGSANINGVTTYPILVGKWCTATAPKGKIAGAKENYCIKQVGAKCYFLYNWSRTSTTNWLVGGTNGGVPDGQITLNTRRYSTATGVTWQHTAGSEVSLRSDNGYVYVVSDSVHTATTDLKRVRAYRQVPIGDVNSTETVRQLVTVPASYYEVTLNDANFKHTMVDGTVQKPMTVKIDPPLSQRGQGWEDEIYCSLATRITSEPRNTADQIKYILQKYTSLTPDSTTFTTVNANVDNYPSDFALLESADALQTCIDIAWQARCALLTLGSSVKIKYMSPTTPSADGNITIKDDYVLLDEGSAVQEDGLEDRVTVFVAKWNYSYVNPLAQRIIKRVNTDLFDEKIQEFDFYIYQKHDLVDVSAEWWAQRYGRIWKKIQVAGPLPLITFEALDFPNVDIDIATSPANIKGIVEEIKHDTNNHKINMTVWLPIESGSSTESSNGWLAPGSGDTSDPLLDITTGTDDLVAIAASPDGK